jgi:hypothetical protein
MLKRRVERALDNTELYSGCALELARRIASNVVAPHAGFANVNALTEISCIKRLVSLGDASPLLIGVISILRTRR